MTKLVADLLNSAGTKPLLQATILPLLLLALDFCSQSAAIEVPAPLDTLRDMTMCGLGVSTTAFLASLVEKRDGMLLQPAGAFIGILIAGLFWGALLIVSRFERDAKLSETAALVIGSIVAFISSYTSFLSAILLLRR